MYIYIERAYIQYMCAYIKIWNQLFVQAFLDILV